MSLFSTINALKKLGDTVDKEIIVKKPLTTIIEGPANSVIDVPHPHGIPMAMKLYSGPKGLSATDSLHVVDVQYRGGRHTIIKPDIPGMVMENLARAAGSKPQTSSNNTDELFNNEINLNHIQHERDNKIDVLSNFYKDGCFLKNHETCSVNLKKSILYKCKPLLEKILRAHDLPFVPNPRGIPNKDSHIRSSIVNMMDVFRTTPLMIAASVGDYRMLVMLLEYGADPCIQTKEGHTALSLAAKHSEEKLIKILIDYGAHLGIALMMYGLHRPSLRRLKTEDVPSGPTNYGFNFEPILILTQPKFLLRTRNPILDAFRVGTILRKIGQKRDEYMGDCEELIEQTDDFAFYYLDQCRSMWEALLLLKDQGADGTTDLLQYALKKRKMKFISHHYCQQYIMDTWYGGVQTQRIRNTIKKMAQLFLFHIFMPFFIVYSIVTLAINFDLMTFIGFQYSQPLTMWRHLHTPVLSYIVDFLNFTVLLFSLVQTCLFYNHDQPSPLWESPEVWLWMSLGARFMVEMDKIRTQGRNFFKYVGNCVDLTVSCCIIFTVLLRIITEAEGVKSSSLEAEKFQLWTSYIYASAFLLLMLRMLEMLDVTYTLGPLEGAIGKMMKDVVKVCVLLVICIIGFSVSIWTVTRQSKAYTDYEWKKHNPGKNSTNTYPSLFSSYLVTLKTLVWSTFGLIEPENIAIKYDEYASNFLQLLWGLYLVIAMILFLNMLIAMLTETYVNTINNAEIEWKYARSVVVMKYQGTHPFLFPINLVLYPLFLIFHFLEKRRDVTSSEPSDGDKELWKQSAYLHAIIKSRFKYKFKDVLSVPYFYKTNIFNFYKTHPMKQKVTVKEVRKKRRKMEADSTSSSNEEE